MWNYIRKIVIVLVLITVANIVSASLVSLGKTTNGTSSSDSSTDGISVVSFTAISNGELQTGHARVWVSSGNANSKIVIYSDSGGNPNTLLAVSDEVNISTTTETQIDYTFSGINKINIVSGTTYWIGVAFADPGAGNFSRSRSSTTPVSGIRHSSDTYNDGQETLFNQSGSTSGELDVFIQYDEQNGQTHFFINPNLVKSGLYLDFDGVDERGQTGANPTGNTDTSGSVSCWVTPDTVLAVNGSRHLFGMGGDDTDQATNFGRFFINMRFVSGTYNNRVEMFHAIDNSATINRVIGNTELSAGNLYNIVVTSSGTAWKIYVNGTDQTLTTVSGSNTGDWFGDIGTVGNRRYSIGAFYRDGVYASGTYWDGKIDNCTVFSTTLSQTEVTNLYNSGRPIHPCVIISCSSLDTFWKMGEDANGTVTTMHSAIGTPSTDNFTMENMENADIISASYY